MDYLRKKSFEWLLAVVVALLLALWLLPAAGPLPQSAWSYEGACRELAADTTAGRQALVGSLWHAPLPTLVGLPGAALCNHFPSLPVATYSALLLSLIALAYLLRRAISRLFPTLLTPFIWLGALLLLKRLPGLDSNPQLAITLTLATATLVKLADWSASQRLYDFVKFSFALAFLALCGAPLAGFTLALTLLMPLLVILNPATRRRTQGLLILGLLPLLYALAVWHLMSHLILSDALYPWRALIHTPLQWHGWSRVPFTRANLGALLMALLLLLLSLWRRDRRTVVLSLATLSLFVWLILLHSLALGWSATAANTTLTLSACLTLAAAVGNVWFNQHHPGTPLCRLGTLLALALLLSAGLPSAPAVAVTRPETRQEHQQLCQEVAAQVRRLTPYGRVFVTGYRGLGLLLDQNDDLFLPNLDLHPDRLRQEYQRQHLFLLLPQPTGAAAFESPVWRHGDIYRHGMPRALFAAEWPGWRLYEIVTAPGAAELDEWRNHL